MYEQKWYEIVRLFCNSHHLKDMRKKYEIILSKTDRQTYQFFILIMENSYLQGQRNPLLSLWNVLFEDNLKEWISFKPALGLPVYPCYACRHM